MHSLQPSGSGKPSQPRRPGAGSPKSSGDLRAGSMAKDLAKSENWTLFSRNSRKRLAKSRRGNAMQLELVTRIGMKFLSRPLLQTSMQKKNAGKERFGCVSLRRLPPEGHASLKLGLRANALGVFR